MLQNLLLLIIAWPGFEKRLNDDLEKRVIGDSGESLPAISHNRAPVLNYYHVDSTVFKPNVSSQFQRRTALSASSRQQINPWHRFNADMSMMLETLTTRKDVVILSNMDAELLFNERRVLSESTFVEMVVWRVPRTQAGSTHSLKYRLALVVDGVCVLRYDNESGKGDHKHTGDEEVEYTFTTPVALLDDFWKDIDSWRL